MDRVREDAIVDDFLGALRLFFLPAIVIATSAAVMVFLAFSLTPRRYTSEATILVEPSDSGLTALGGAFSISTALSAGAYKAASLSGPLVSSVAASMGDSPATPTELAAYRSRVTATAESSQGTNMLVIAYTASSPTAAERGAQAWANAVIAWDEARTHASLNTVIAAYKQQIAAINKQLSGSTGVPKTVPSLLDQELALRANTEGKLLVAESLASTTLSRLTIISPAELPLKPSSPRRVLYTGVAFVLVIVLVYTVYIRTRLPPFPDGRGEGGTVQSRV